MSTTTITLAFPIEYKEGGTVSALSMRRPKLKDQLRSITSGKSDAESEKDLFANLCEQAPDFMDELDLLDYQALQNAFRDFLSSTNLIRELVLALAHFKGGGIGEWLDMSAEEATKYYELAAKYQRGSES